MRFLNIFQQFFLFPFSSTFCVVEMCVKIRAQAINISPLISVLWAHLSLPHFDFVLWVRSTVGVPLPVAAMVALSVAAAAAPFVSPHV
jgi:hypothetical protein